VETKIEKKEKKMSHGFSEESFWLDIIDFLNIGEKYGFEIRGTF
jgi:hypothetical protein